MGLDLGMNLSSTEILRVAESRPYVLWMTSIITLLLFWSVRDWNRLSKFPLITEKSLWDISGTKAKESFKVNARGEVERGFKQVCMPHWKRQKTSASRKLTPNFAIIQVGASKPFRVISGVGEMLILPPSLANDIRNNEKLSFAEYMKEVCDLLRPHVTSNCCISM